MSHALSIEESNVSSPMSKVCIRFVELWTLDGGLWTNAWCPRKDLNLQPLVCRTSALSVELLGQELIQFRVTSFAFRGQSKYLLETRNPKLYWWSELESNQPLGFFKPTLIRLSYPTENIVDCRFAIPDWSDNKSYLSIGNWHSAIDNHLRPSVFARHAPFP